jgi:hypothetical protein
MQTRVLRASCAAGRSKISDEKRRDNRPVRPYESFLGRFFTGITNFNPDQTSVMAQTFTSTRPTASPLSRIIFSVRSVTTPELFFGQEIHNIPAGARDFAARGRSDSSSALELAKRKMKSRFLSQRCWIRHFASGSRSSFFTSSGTRNRAARKFSWIPNFFSSGVPEYPGMAACPKKMC